MNNTQEFFKIASEKGFKALTLTEDGNSMYCSAESLVSVLSSLKTDYEYEQLWFLTAVDNTTSMELVYQVMKLKNADFVRIKVKLEPNKLEAPSISGLWKAADVQEREVFDLFGIVFTGHPELKRILLPEEFEGHPLRKDFALDIPERF